MTGQETIKRLRTTNPHIAITVTREIDESYTWEGDGPDPVMDGFDAYAVEVRASSIINGEIVSESDYLGGCYFKRDEETGEVGGYLPDMVEAAMILLRARIPAQ